jgi:O-antigen/teichoic acid export membrane protein
MSAAATTIAPAHPRPASLQINFAWTSAGNAVYAASQWGMVSLLAHAGGATLVGQYALGLAVTAPLLMFAQLNLRSVLATDPHAETNFTDYRDLRFLAIAAALLLTAPAAWLGQAPWTAVLATAAMQGAEWISDIYLGLQQRRENMRRIAISLALRGVASLAILGAVIATTANLAAALAAVTVARIGIFLFYDRNVITQVAPAAPRRTTRLNSLIKTAAPLGIVLLLASVASNMPRYWIAQLLNEHSVGLFAAIASLGTAANLIVNALGQAATPKLARLHAAGDRLAFLHLTLKLSALGLALCAAGIAGSLLLGPQLLRLAYGPEFQQQTKLFAAIMAACGLGYVASLLGYALTAARVFAAQVPLQIVTMLTTAAGCALLIPSWGLTGAAAGVGAGNLVQALAEAWLLARNTRSLEPAQ